MKLRCFLFTFIIWNLVFAVFGVSERAQAGSLCERSLLSGAKSLREVFRPVLRHLDETEAVFLQIVKKYPMSTHEYVFMGRSPTLMAALAEVQKVYFGDLRAWILPVSLKNQSAVSPRLLKARFDSVFSTYRGRSKTTPARTLVFIDVVASGRTFLTLDRLISDSGQKAVLVGMASEPAALEQVLKASQVQTPYTLLPVSESYMMDLGHQKIFAPFGSHEIESESYQFNAQYSSSLISGALFADLVEVVKDELEY